jgi:hypothetical protein
MTRMFDRRSLLRSGVTGAAAAVITPSAARTRLSARVRRPVTARDLGKFTELLAIPPVIDLRAGGSHTFTTSTPGWRAGTWSVTGGTPGSRGTVLACRTVCMSCR